MSKGRGQDKRGRSAKGDKWRKVSLRTMQTPAWKALGPHAQRLYPWLQFEWNGTRENNNGDIRLSIRQAAELLDCSRTSACNAFADLQAKGFLVVHETAVLGVDGEARGNSYELTEYGLPPGGRARQRALQAAREGTELPKRFTEENDHIPRKLFAQWRRDRDFPIVKARANNPRGIGGLAKKQNPIPEIGTGPVPVAGTPRPRRWDEEADYPGTHVPVSGTSLITRGSGGEAAEGAESETDARRFAIVTPDGAVRRVGVRLARSAAKSPTHQHASPRGARAMRKATRASPLIGTA